MSVVGLVTKATSNPRAARVNDGRALLMPSPGAATSAFVGGEAVRDTERRVKLHFELELASGMTLGLADVLRLISIAELGRDFARGLDPYVRDKYAELWRSAQHPDEDY